MHGSGAAMGLRKDVEVGEGKSKSSVNHEMQ